MKASNIFVLLILLILSSSAQKLNLFFNSNSHLLNDHETKKLDSILLIQPKVIINSILSFCDSSGNDEINKVLAKKRAFSVYHYILNKDKSYQVNKIDYIGRNFLGNSLKNKPFNRRVEVIYEINKSIQSKENTDSIITDSTKYISVHFRGISFDENNKPTKVEILIYDQKAKQVFQSFSDLTGNYNFEINLEANKGYNLVTYNDSLMISTKSFNTLNEPRQNIDFKFNLKKLKTGRKYIFENLNFEGDTSLLTEASFPSLNALLKLMERNKKLKIRIDGHVNYPNHWGNFHKIKTEGSRYYPKNSTNMEYNYWLAQERANFIMLYLIKNGINRDRLNTKSCGSNEMLYPDTFEESEMSKNRRVEIYILDY